MVVVGAANEDEEAAVRPSSPLIATLHRRLRDPGIVSSFERRRSDDSLSGLVCTRWRLRRPQRDAVGGEEEGDGDGKSNGNAGGNLGDARVGECAEVGETRKCDNAIPDRGHIDLRMEQNGMFADEQCRRCKEMLSNLPQADGGNPPPPPLVSDDHRWKERSDAIRSLLDEGLAACPGHGGLLRVEALYRARIEQSTRTLTGEGPLDLNVPALPASMEAKGKGSGMLGRLAPVAVACREERSKGAEGRARAAMRDALAERSFMLGNDGGVDFNGVGNVDYPPIESEMNAKLGAGGAVVGIGGGKGPLKGGWQGNGESYSSDISDSRGGSHIEDGGRRKRSKYKKRKKKRKKRSKSKKRRRKSRHRHEDGRHRKRRGRSISRSKSRSRSRSPRSISSHSASSSSCRGGRRRGEDMQRERGQQPRRGSHKDEWRSYDVRLMDEKDNEKGNNFCHGDSARGYGDRLWDRDNDDLAK